MKVSKVNEWRPVYINKKILMTLLEPFTLIEKSTQFAPQEKLKMSFSFYQSGLLHELSPSLLEELKQVDQEFVSRIQSEFEKCDNFFRLHHNLLCLKYRKLNYNLLIIGFQNNSTNQFRTQYKQDFYQLKIATENLYQDCKLLQQYVIWNIKTSKKLMKLYKKNVFLQTTKAQYDKIDQIYQQMFIIQGQAHLERLIRKIQTIYLRCLTSKDNEGLSQLKYNNQYRSFSEFQKLSAGIFIGFSFCMLSYIIMSRYELVTFYDKDYDLLFPLFRCLGLFILFYWSLIFCVYCWQKGNVGYRQIMNFKYHSSTIPQMIQRAGFITMVFFIIFLLSIIKEITKKQELSEEKYYISYIAKNISFNPIYGPLIIWIVIFIYMFFPSKVYFNGKGRIYFGRLVWTSFLPIFYPQPFINQWGTDNLLSLVVPTRDLGTTVCFYYNQFFYSSDPNLLSNQQQCSDTKRVMIGLVLPCFGLLLRWLQLFKGFYDQKSVSFDEWCVVGIYVIITFVFVFGYLQQFPYHAFFVIWIVSCALLLTTCYYWDLRKDWGLLDFRSKNKGLRDLIAFNKLYYFIVFGINLFVRCGWLLTISPETASYFHIWPQFFVMMLAIIEMGRRTIWNTIRVENVHSQNMGQFKAIQTVKFPYENYIDRTQYQNWKQNKVEPSDTENLRISIMDGNVNRSEIATFRASMPASIFDSTVRNKIEDDLQNLEQLSREEELMIQDTVFNDQRNQSLTMVHYSEFRDSHIGNTAKLIQTEKQLKQLVKKVKAQIMK